MPNYSVTISVAGRWSFAVEADNEAAAIGKAQSTWETGTVELDPGEFEPQDKWLEAEVSEMPEPVAKAAAAD